MAILPITILQPWVLTLLQSQQPTLRDFEADALIRSAAVSLGDQATNTYCRLEWYPVDAGAIAGVSAGQVTQVAHLLPALTAANATALAQLLMAALRQQVLQTPASALRPVIALLPTATATTWKSTVFAGATTTARGAGRTLIARDTLAHAIADGAAKGF